MPATLPCFIVPNLQVIMKSCRLIISKVKKMVLNGLRSLQKQITHKLATGFTMTRWRWLKLSEKVRTCPNSTGLTPATPDGWISCSERMPNDKQYVWCWGKSYGWTECDTFEGYYDWSRNKWWAVTDDGEEPASKVTHWMPLPEPPQEVK